MRYDQEYIKINLIIDFDYHLQRDVNDYSPQRIIFYVF